MSDCLHIVFCPSVDVCVVVRVIFELPSFILLTFQSFTPEESPPLVSFASRMCQLLCFRFFLLCVLAFLFHCLLISFSVCLFLYLLACFFTQLLLCLHLVVSFANIRRKIKTKKRLWRRNPLAAKVTTRKKVKEMKNRRSRRLFPCSLVFRVVAVFSLSFVISLFFCLDSV